MRDEIIRLIAEVANRGQSDFDDEASLRDHLHLDDLGLLELQLLVEDLVETKIEDDKWTECETVLDVITLAGSSIATH